MLKSAIFSLAGVLPETDLAWFRAFWLLLLLGRGLLPRFWLFKRSGITAFALGSCFATLEYEDVSVHILKAGTTGGRHRVKGSSGLVAK